MSVCELCPIEGEGPTGITAGVRNREVTAARSLATPLAKWLYTCLFHIIPFHSEVFFKRKVVFFGEKKNFFKGMRVIDLVKIPNSTKEVTRPMDFLLSLESYDSSFLRLKKHI